MASQKSSVVAVEPKRQRGRDRVAAIMDAGAAVFTRKGYAAATMTEIAAEAGAAIGSLYRFFPTKEALAEALVARYGAFLTTAFAEIEAKVDELTPLELAGALIEVMQSHAPERAAAIALIDARPDALELRSTLRGALRAATAGIVTKTAPGLSAPDALTAATLLLHVLKSLRNLPRSGKEADARLALEARALIARYLAGLGKQPQGA
ncbi:MAG: TetR/AcrR family transcriptional regulator [Hyphomicrobiales bacterium]|nr:TetR/AcrR family transcriptional regulator [Hyphomicrobiales bacterium]